MFAPKIGVLCEIQAGQQKYNRRQVIRIRLVLSIKCHTLTHRHNTKLYLDKLVCSNSSFSARGGQTLQHRITSHHEFIF